MGITIPAGRVVETVVPNLGTLAVASPHGQTIIYMEDLNSIPRAGINWIEVIRVFTPFANNGVSGRYPLYSGATFIGYIEDGLAWMNTIFGNIPRRVKIEASPEGMVEYVAATSLTLAVDSINSIPLINRPSKGMFNSPPGSMTLTYPVAQYTHNVQTFAQIGLNNKHGSGSCDLIAYPDNCANDTTGFVDIGVCGSVFADPNFVITSPNDAYLFGSAPAGSGKNGNLIIATDSTGTRNDIVFCTNGFGQAANKRFKIKKEGMVNFIPLASDPAGAEKGDMYFNSTTNKMKVFNGTIWETITSA